VIISSQRGNEACVLEEQSLRQTLSAQHSIRTIKSFHCGMRLSGPAFPIAFEPLESIGGDLQRRAAGCHGIRTRGDQRT
jgi:hypothetical protein